MDTGASSNVVQVNDSLTITHASMSGNPRQNGLAAGKTIRITESVVAGHGVDLAARRLRAVNVSCDHSRRFGADGLVIGTWQVCAND